MSFNLYLYRAPEGLGPWSTWSEMHAQPLATRQELQLKLDSLFQPLRWELREGHAWASYPFDDERFPREVSLVGAAGEILTHITVYSGPPAIRTIMRALDLNYCYAPEADELYHPFATGSLWPGEAAC